MPNFPTPISIRGYGCIPDRPDINDIPFKLRRAATGALPATLNRVKHCFTPYDQGEQGSCTGHGTVTAARDALRFHGLPDFLGSRAAVYALARMKEGTLSVDSGAMVRDALDAVHKCGLIDEKLMPYSDKVFDVAPTAAQLADGMKRLGFEYQRVDNRVWDAIRAALVQNGNIVYGATLYPDFESEHVAKTGTVPMPKKGQRAIGGHCFSGGGGYTTTRGICQNSWGTDWASGGFFTMPKAYLTDTDLTSDAWTWTRVAGQQ